MLQTTTWATRYRVPNTLPSDTEESVVGTQWHQDARDQLTDMLRDVADRRGASWGVCEEITLIGLQHEDGTDYDPKPDVMVLRQPLPRGSIASVRLDQVGAPLFIAEVASDSTKGNDQGDKRAAYAAVGVPEYIVFDPDGDLLSAPLLAWRLDGATYVPWRPAADGWWHSHVLDVSFQPGHPYVSVRDRDGVVLAPSGVVRRRARVGATTGRGGTCTRGPRRDGPAAERPTRRPRYRVVIAVTPPVSSLTRHRVLGHCLTISGRTSVLTAYPD